MQLYQTQEQVVKPVLFYILHTFIKSLHQSNYVWLLILLSLPLLYSSTVCIDLMSFPFSLLSLSGRTMSPFVIQSSTYVTARN